MMSWLKNLGSNSKSALIKEAQAKVTEIQQSRSLQPIQTGTILQKAEQAYLSEQVKLKENRAVGERVGIGLGSRVMKNLYVGTSKSQYTSHQEVKDIDAGELLLTNKRIIFSGMKEQRVIDLEKILSFDIFADAIAIKSSNKSKASYFMVKNPYIWKAYFTIVHGVDDPQDFHDVNVSISFE